LAHQGLALTVFSVSAAVAKGRQGEAMMRYVRQVLGGWVLLGLVASMALAQPAQVLIIRHAEPRREKGASSLSLIGQERAMALVPYLTQTPELIFRGLPAALFATGAVPGDLSQFALETIGPLSQRLRVLTGAHYAKWEFGNLAHEVLSNPRYERKNVLICWDREYIPQLAAALGVRAELPSWPESGFDRVWVITYKGEQASLVNTPQRLLFGDAAD
jgi:hypothetical protein